MSENPDNDESPSINTKSDQEINADKGAGSEPSGELGGESSFSQDPEWEQYKDYPHLQYNPKQNLYRCTECEKTLLNSKAAGSHQSIVHEGKGNRKGNPGKRSSEKQQDNTGTQSEDDSDDYSENKESQGQNQGIPSIEDLTKSNINDYIASQVAGIGKNHDLFYYFKELRKRKLIPPSWDFATFVTTMTSFALKRVFGIEFDVAIHNYQLHPDIVEFYERAAYDWEQYEQAEYEEFASTEKDKEIPQEILAKFDRSVGNGR